MSSREPVPISYLGSIAAPPDSLSHPVRRAMATVRRHRFLDGWYELAFGESRPTFTHIDFDRDTPSDEHLSIVYSDQPLVTAHDGLFPTSSTSQPSLVAAMLQSLDVAPGMRILEIGTGTGYNAALLAELSGSSSNICTIECQQIVADKAKRFLKEEGYGDVRVVCGDGFYGIEDFAPYDRIIATVGCSDISPHWLAQLKPEGSMLIPITHGFSDPLARLGRDPQDSSCALGAIAARAAFMKIQGILEWGTPWSSFSIRGLPTEPVWRRPLPQPLMATNPTHHPLSDQNHWAFQYFLALCSRELWYDNRGYGLADPGSSSVIIVKPEGVEAFSVLNDDAACEILYERLQSITSRWIDLGMPSPEDYRLTFCPRSHFNPSASDLSREWIIERPRFMENVQLV